MVYILADVVRALELGSSAVRRILDALPSSQRLPLVPRLSLLDSKAEYACTTLASLERVLCQPLVASSAALERCRCDLLSAVLRRDDERGRRRSDIAVAVNRAAGGINVDNASVLLPSAIPVLSTFIGALPESIQRSVITDGAADTLRDVLHECAATYRSTSLSRADRSLALLLPAWMVGRAIGRGVTYSSAMLLDAFGVGWSTLAQARAVVSICGLGAPPPRKEKLTRRRVSSASGRSYEELRAEALEFITSAPVMQLQPDPKRCVRGADGLPTAITWTALTVNDAYTVYKLDAGADALGSTTFLELMRSSAPQIKTALRSGSNCSGCADGATAQEKVESLLKRRHAAAADALHSELLSLVSRVWAHIRGRAPSAAGEPFSYQVRCVE